MCGLVLLFVGVVLLDSLVLTQRPGVGAYLGAASELERVYALSLASGGVLTVSAAATGLLWQAWAAPLAGDVLRGASFLLVMLGVLLASDQATRRGVSGPLHGRREFLALVASNCALLGLTVLDADAMRSPSAAVAHGLAAALGFGLLLVAFTSMRERLEASDVPPAMRGVPIVLLTAGLMALALIGLARVMPA